MEKHFANDLTGKTNQVLVVSSDESEITVGNDFKYDTVGNSFTYNDLKYSPSSVNFTTATHVYANYNCEIFKNSEGILRLKYYDLNDVIVITDITD